MSRATCASACSPRAPAPTCRRSSTSSTAATGSRCVARRLRQAGGEGARARRARRGSRPPCFPARRVSPTARRATARSPTGSSGREVELVVLAGYMQLLSAGFIAPLRRPDRSTSTRRCCPSFPGLDAIGQALDARGPDHRGHGALRRRGRRLRADRPPAAGPGAAPTAIASALEAAIHATEHASAAGGDPADRRRAGLDRARRTRVSCGSPRKRDIDSATMGIEAAITAEGGRAAAGIPVRVRRALISVSDKTGVRRLRARARASSGSRSSPPAAPPRRSARPGSRSPTSPSSPARREILDGRVKTLHPRLHAALLARRDDPSHMATLEAEGIEPIDLVCVNLYPFERTVEQLGRDRAEAVENIDIGGPTMIRAAAKNHNAVAVVVRPESLRRGARGAAASPAARSRPRRGTGSPTRRSPTRPPTTRRSRAGSALRYEAFPEPLGDAAREVPRAPLRREPAPEGGALHRVRGPLARALAGSPSSTASRSRSTTSSTSTRRGGCSTSSSSRPA